MKEATRMTRNRADAHPVRLGTRRAVTLAMLVLALVTTLIGPAPSAAVVFPTTLPGTADITFHNDTHVTDTVFTASTADIESKWQGTLVLVGSTASTATYQFAPLSNLGTGQMVSSGQFQSSSQFPLPTTSWG